MQAAQRQRAQLPRLHQREAPVACSLLAAPGQVQLVRLLAVPVVVLQLRARLDQADKIHRDKLREVRVHLEHRPLAHRPVVLAELVPGAERQPVLQRRAQLVRDAPVARGLALALTRARVVRG